MNSTCSLLWVFCSGKEEMLDSEVIKEELEVTDQFNHIAQTIISCA